ncbi:MAG: oligosaccharide flippase family protein [Victivallaceae bacterium]|nr:oligosaccharide flippase family protein [Victivallaceae bacterium]
MYGLLLDFGLGVTAQKYTASNLWPRDLKRYNMVLSAIFSFHAAMSLLIIAASCVLAFVAPRLFSVSDPEMITYCRQCLRLFGFGAALVFPTGIFSEIVVRMRALYLRNYVLVTGKMIELIGVLLILGFGGRLRGLIVFNIAMMLAINLTLAVIVVRRIHGFRLHRHVNRAILREIIRFSGYMYVVSLFRLMTNNHSRPLISAFCDLNSAGVFQIASRFPALCVQFTSQYQENVSPITAGLYADGKMVRQATSTHRRMWRFTLGNTVGDAKSLVSLQRVKHIVYHQIYARKRKSRPVVWPAENQKKWWA